MATLGQIYKDTSLRDGITVNKTFMVPLDRIFEEQGFNVRSHNEENIIKTATAWRNGEDLPALLVESQEDGTFKLVDGHRRYHSALYANENYGCDITRIECKETKARTRVEQVALMCKSSEGVPLTSLERGKAYQRIQSEGKTNDEIAVIVNRSKADVQLHLSVAMLPESITRRIDSGEITASLAIELCRKQGEKAVDEAIEKAKSQGKNQASRSHTTLWKPTMGKKLVEALFNDDMIVKSKPGEFPGGIVDVSMSYKMWELIQQTIQAFEGESK